MFARSFVAAPAAVVALSLAAASVTRVARAEEPASKPPPAVVLTLVPPTHLKLAVPAGYERDGRTRSWERKSVNVSFHVDEGTRVDLTDAKQWAAYLAQRDLKVTARADVKVAGVPGVLYSLESARSETPNPERLAIATQGGLQLTIRAHAPFGRAPVLDEMLAGLLRESVWDPNMVVERFAEYPWTIDTPHGMRFRESADVGVIFVAEQESAAASADPAAVAVVSHLDRLDDAAERTPEVRLEHLAQLHARRFGKGLRESRASRMQGRAAWELIADVTQDKTKPTVVYMVFVAADTYDVSMYCTTKPDVEPTWLPRFRTFVNTWKPKPLSPEDGAK